MKADSACKKDERGFYWSCTVDRCHSPSHSCAQRCISQATNSAIQPPPMFLPCQDVQMFCDHVAFKPHPIARLSHQEYSSYPYRTRCSNHQPAPVSNHWENQREDQQGKMLLRDHQPVLNLEHIPVRWHQGGSKIDYPVVMSCSHCHDPFQGLDLAVWTAHQIGPFSIPVGGRV